MVFLFGGSAVAALLGRFYWRRVASSGASAKWIGGLYGGLIAGAFGAAIGVAVGFGFYREHVMLAVEIGALALYPVGAIIGRATARSDRDKFIEDVQEASLPWRCPECQAENPNTSYVCLACGYRLV